MDQSKPNNSISRSKFFALTGALAVFIMGTSLFVQKKLALIAGERVGASWIIYVVGFAVLILALSPITHSLWLRRWKDIVGENHGKKAVFVHLLVLQSPVFAIYHYLFLLVAPRKAESRESEDLPLVPKSNFKKNYLAAYCIGFFSFHLVFISTQWMGVTSSTSFSRELGFKSLFQIEPYLPFALKYFLNIKREAGNLLDVQSQMDQVSKSQSVFQDFKNRDAVVETAAKALLYSNAPSTTSRIVLSSYSVMNHMKEKALIDTAGVFKDPAIERPLFDIRVSVEMIEQLEQINTQSRHKPLSERLGPLGIATLVGSVQLAVIYAIENKTRLAYEEVFHDRLRKLIETVKKNIDDLKSKFPKNNDVLLFERRALAAQQRERELRVLILEPFL